MKARAKTDRRAEGRPDRPRRRIERIEKEEREIRAILRRSEGRTR